MLRKDMVTTNSFKTFLKISEAAEFLGVHPDTLRRWERSGKMRSFRHPFNRYRLYRQEDLERALKMERVA